MTKYEYGAMSSKFPLVAENKLTAYATMCLHYQENAMRFRKELKEVSPK